jgi:hypothetical protein
MPRSQLNEVTLSPDCFRLANKKSAPNQTDDLEGLPYSIPHYLHDRPLLATVNHYRTEIFSPPMHKNYATMHARLGLNQPEAMKFSFAHAGAWRHIRA